MKRRGRRKQQIVRYLPDNSWLSQTNGAVHSTPNTTQTGLISILPGVGGVPEALVGAASPPAGANLTRANVDSLILDHIHGKVFWEIEGNDGTHADAAGNWLWVIRMALVVTAVETTGAAALATLFGTPLIDPGASTPVFLQGSYQPEGLRILWRRSWMSVVNFATGFGRDGIVSSEQACPPSGYVDIKPHRILRSNEQLALWYESQAIGLTGATDSARVWFGHDLRVAAHNTQRRR